MVRARLLAHPGGVEAVGGGGPEGWVGGEQAGEQVLGIGGDGGEVLGGEAEVAAEDVLRCLLVGVVQERGEAAEIGRNG